MRKSHRHDELSDRKCLKCAKPLKLRMVETKDARVCYGCHRKKEANRGHYVNANPRKKRIVKGLPVKSF
jgi:hypothetical protein